MLGRLSITLVVVSVVGCGSSRRPPGGEGSDGAVATDGGRLDGAIETDGFVPPRPDGGGECGDAVVDSVEECDDGNSTVGDGCDASCRVEDGFGCDGSPSTCTPTRCDDGVQNGGETDVDCGRVCPDQCSVDEGCAAGDDCRSGVCTGAACAAPTCTDGVMNGLERDVDCGGGTCSGCDTGERCLLADHCSSRVCASDATCAAPTCTDGVLNQAEVDVDCAGPCGPCGYGRACTRALDCSTGLCEMQLGTLRCVEYPHIDSLEPNLGHAFDTVVIHGSGFHGLGSPSPPTVTFGTTPALSTAVIVVSDAEIRTSAPTGPTGTVNVTVTNFDGRGGNSVPFTYVPAATFGTPVTTAVATGWVVDRVRTGDLDGDGDADVLVADRGAQPSVRVFRNASGALVAGATVTFAANVSDFRVARVDAGASLDIVASLANGSVGVATGRGDGTFDPPSVIAVGDAAGELWVGDIDIDGTADVILTYTSTFLPYWGFLAGHGDGTFDPVVSVPLASNGRAITAFQLRGDATLEAFVGVASEIRLVRRDPLRGWVSDVPDRYILGDGRALDGFDLDDDGDDDLVTATTVLESDSGTLVGVGASYGGGTAFATAQFDGDGNGDIASVEGGAYVEVRLGRTGFGFGTTMRTILLPSAAYSVAAADIDRDGDPDLVVGAIGIVCVVPNTTP